MGRPLIDLVGQRFARVTVLRRVIRQQYPEQTFWECQCACGVLTITNGYRLKTGATTSCGCAARERSSGQLRTHGMSRTPEYAAWSQARARCRDVTHQAYRHYGGRGITVCAAWDRDFRAFLSDMGLRPSRKHTLDRIDNDGPYAPGNCRWVTMQQQHNNRRRNVRLTWNGEQHTIAEWARITGISRQALYQRMRYGWTVERALTTPLQP